MAGSIYVPLKTVYDDSGARKAQKSISALGKSIKGSLAGIGIGLSVGALFSELEQAARAAGQDAKSYAVLANTLKNVTNASDGAVASADAYIQKLAMQVGIADDQLRPVLGRLVQSTGDLTKAQDLLAVAADLAAAKNIDLSAAGNALAKAVGGQTTALFRLAPELKKSSDWMTALKQETAGAATTAANADPFQRLTVIFGEMQESIGRGLLPVVQLLADFLASEQFQTAFTNLSTDIADIITGIGELGKMMQDLDAIADGFWASIGVPQVDFGWIESLVGRFIPLYNILKFIKNLGTEQNAKMNGADETSRLIRRRLESLGAISGTDAPAAAKASGTTKKLTTDTSALTKAVQAAKDAFDAKVKAYQEAVTAAQGVIDSTKEMTAGFVALFKVTPQMGEFETKVVDGFDAIYEKIKSILADKRILQSSADALTKYADSTLATLRGLAKQQDVLAQKIDIARTITSGVTGLANLTGMLDTITQSVTETTRSMSNGIETIMTKTFDVTKTGGIVDNFKALVDKTKAFAKNLIDLKKLGLNKNLFAQLVQAGADAGGATAQALVDGGSDTISALNDLYDQLDMTAASIAETSTQTLYDVGQQVVTNGFIEGLVSQQDALVAAAQSMAQAFADAFNAQMASALQIALPSVPLPSNGSTDMSSLLSNRPDPTRSPQRYAAWLAGIGGIDPIRSPQSYAAAQAAKNTTLNVTVNAGLGTNGNTVAQDIVTALKKYEAVNGSVWVSA